MFTVKFRSTDGVWFILPAIGFASDRYGVRLGIFFLLGGIEIEYETSQSRR